MSNPRQDELKRLYEVEAALRKLLRDLEHVGINTEDKMFSRSRDALKLHRYTATYCEGDGPEFVRTFTADDIDHAVEQAEDATEPGESLLAVSPT